MALYLQNLRYVRGAPRLKGAAVGYVDTAGVYSRTVVSILYRMGER